MLKLSMKKVLAVLLSVIFVTSLTAVAASARYGHSGWGRGGGWGGDPGWGSYGLGYGVGCYTDISGAIVCPGYGLGYGIGYPYYGGYGLGADADTLDAATKADANGIKNNNRSTFVIRN